MLVATILAASCGVGNTKSQPTAAQAGANLKAHILKLLDKVSARGPRITDPGGKDIPCGAGKVKRTFAATALDNAEQTTPRSLNEMMLGTLSGFADYRLTGPGGPDFNVVSEGTKTSLHLNSSKHGEYSVSGETACLSRS
ncbi:hypothetical protein [Spongiactinospora gelatinilytica]|uniref:hypothetical protein n=1 Tax=Spongiactinospora gelatinilytica TaxID=2666298 RepID=UPI0011B9357B|nr:hypothetical protein [Spongiactinospora gelatinilytica]